VSKRSRNKKAVAAQTKSAPQVEEKKFCIFSKPIIHFLLIFILGVIIYSNTLNSPFLWDDDTLIFKNANIRNLSNFTDFSGTRHLTFLSFALNYRIGGYDVTGYHVFNIAIHIINAILVYLLMLMILKTPRFKESSISQFSSLLALFSGLLFVSHPVYTMAITNINQRSVPLATFFYLLSLILYIKARISGDSFLSRKHFPFYILSVISAVFAMKCKEISFTLPMVIFIFDRYFFGKEYTLKKSFIYLVPILLALLIIPLSSPQADVFKRQDSTSFGIQDTSVLSGLDAQKLSNIPRKDYMLTEFRVILTYVRLFFLPINLNFAYQYPIYRSLSDPNVYLSFFLLLMVLASAIYLFIKARKTGNWRYLILSFGIIWFFINLSLESLAVVLNYVIFEYRLYLPSIGIIMALMPLMDYFMSQSSKMRRNLYLSAVAAVILTISIGTYNRNAVFKDTITFWEDVVKKSPTIIVAHNNLGNAYAKEAQMNDAEIQYKAALNLNPNYSKAHNNLGNVYNRTGRIKEAIEEYKTALEINPNYAEAYNNLSHAYLNAGRINEAIESYKTALRLNPNYPEAHKNLAIVYAGKGRLKEAIEEYKAALKINPDDAQTHNNLGTLYIREGRLKDGIDEYKSALKINLDYASAHNNLGLAYAREGKSQEAVEEYKAALKINPNDAEVHNNIALVYYNSGMVNNALEHIRLALKLNPDYANAHFNLGLIYLKDGMTNEARKEFETVLRINHGDQQARKALSLISKAKNRQ